MFPRCRQFRESWIDHAGSRVPREPESDAHRDGCADCDAFAQRVDAHARALQGLERVRAPAELAGLVVATLHEGQRQDRAVSALAALGRKSAPGELDRAVLDVPRAFEAHELDSELVDLEPGVRATDDAGRRHAPHVLDRLVDEELREPSKALVRRFAGRLPRLAAPAALDDRVARLLTAGAPLRRATRAPLLRAAALFVVFGAGAAAFFWARTRESNASEWIAVRVEHVNSASELGPAARALLGGLTGGLSELDSGANGLGALDGATGEPR